MLQKGDLFVCFLGAMSGDPPRVGLWPEDAARGCPSELASLADGHRRWVGALSLPAEFTKRAALTRRGQEEIRHAIAHGFQTDSALLDARKVAAVARSRGKSRLEKALASRGLELDQYLTAGSGGYAAPRIKADVIELLDAVEGERWEDAARIIHVARVPDWHVPDAHVAPLTINPKPAMITDPTVLDLLEHAIAGVEKHAQVATGSEHHPESGTTAQTPNAPGRGQRPTPRRLGRVATWWADWSTRARLVSGVVAVVLVASVIFGLMRLGGSAGGEGAPVTTAGGSVEPVVHRRGTRLEYADNHLGSPVFAKPDGSHIVDAPARIPYGTKVFVECEVPNDSEGSPSVTAYYLVVGGTWDGDYVVSDTMSNGGPLGNTNTPDVDPHVPPCRR